MRFIDASKNELLTGLNNLTFLDNFKAFKSELTLSAGEEVRIFNSLRPQIPSYWIKVRETGSDGKLVDGDTNWTGDYVYLKNEGSGSMTATVIFFA